MNSHGCHVRRATRDDLDDLADLLAVLFEIETEFMIDRAKQRRGLMMLIDGDASVINCAEIKGEVVGMCSAQCLVSTAMGGRSAFVEDLVVDEDYRGYGVGTLLLASMESWAKENDVNRLQLLVDRQNAEALLFYTKLRWGETRMMCRRRYV